MPHRYLAPPTKSKRDKQGFERFDYYGVSAQAFMSGMRKGKYGKEKVSRKGSSISRQMGRTWFTLAIKIPKKDRKVM
jgi:hypothetical protein